VNCGRAIRCRTSSLILCREELPIIAEGIKKDDTERCQKVITLDWKIRHYRKESKQVNYYLYQKLAEARRQDLLCEAEQRRLLAQLPGQYQSLDQETVYGLGSFLTRLGMLFLSVLRNLLCERIVFSAIDSDACTCCTGEMH